MVDKSVLAVALPIIVSSGVESTLLVGSTLYSSIVVPLNFSKL